MPRLKTRIPARNNKLLLFTNVLPFLPNKKCFNDDMKIALNPQWSNKKEKTGKVTKTAMTKILKSMDPLTKREGG